MTSILRLLVPLAAFLVACGPVDTDPGTDDTDTDATSDTDGTTVGGPWTFGIHPCDGNKVDVLEFVSDDEGFLGCGTDTTGLGLFLTDNGGTSWSAPTTDPAGYFDGFRVMGLFVDGDDVYVAGDAANSTVGETRVMVAKMDMSASPYVVTEVLERGTTVGTSFNAGSYAETSTGKAIAESQTGNGLMVREDADASFVDGAGYVSGGGDRQILDLVVYDDEFYGCGSTIAEPPSIFIPNDTATGASFDIVEMSDSWTGELWHIDVSADGIVVGGVDQDGDVGVAFLSGADISDADGYAEVDLGDIFPGEKTWVEGVCRDGDTVALVGRFSQKDDAIVLVSDDGGETFEDVTPEGVSSVYRCDVLSGGRVAIGATGGTFGLYTPE